MNPLFLAFALALVAAQVVLPRRLAFLPLLVAVCHLPMVPILGIGNFSITRLLIGVGLIRAGLSGALIWSPRHPLDRLVLLWACVAILTSLAHEGGESSPLVFSLGFAYNFAGAYLCARAFIRDIDELSLLTKYFALALIPLALLMVVEKATGQNPYAIFGGVSEISIIRDGQIRAQGPFAHPILAGTAGASSLLLFVALWRKDRRWATAGIVACTLITLSSASSGPLLTAMVALAALPLWRWRTEMRKVRLGALAVLILLHMVMKSPVWYLMARIDLTGSSTGWHRAELITAGLDHLDEWWLWGTDYTRHWMPTGVSWSPNHTDITNHYLQMGVIGGLPLMFSLIAILVKAFQLLGRRMAQLRETMRPAEFVLWCVGGTLFAHSVTFLSVSYFDQVNVLFCVVLGAVPGLCADDSAGAGEDTEAFDQQPSSVKSLESVS